MPTLNTVFKQVFGEALEPLGFKKIKGKYPYFVRLIGDEILHVIAYRNEHMRRPEYKEFDILCGVATVYKYKIDFNISPLDNNNWLKSVSSHYAYAHSNNLNEPLYESIRSFSYIHGDNESIVSAVDFSLKATKDIILPIFDKVTDIDSCIEYFYKNGNAMYLVYDEKRGKFNQEPLYFKTNNYKDLMEKEFEYHREKAEYNMIKENKEHTPEKKLRKISSIEQCLNDPKLYLLRETLLKELETINKCDYDNPKYTQEHFSEARERLEERKNCAINEMNRLLDTAELYSKCLAELERRKIANTEILKFYGLVN